MVSHDRYFLDRVARRIFAFEGNGKIRQYEGGYTDYDNRRKEEWDDSESSTKLQPAENKDSNRTRTHEKKIKFTYKEQKEYETIEADIASLEEKIASLEQEMTKNASDFVKLNALSQEKEAAETELLEKMERWEYLEELAERIRTANG